MTPAPLRAEGECCVECQCEHCAEGTHCKNRGECMCHHTTSATSEKCPCACHKNKLKKPYVHDAKCCDVMNGFVAENPPTSEKVEFSGAGGHSEPWVKENPQTSWEEGNISQALPTNSPKPLSKEELDAGINRLTKIVEESTNSSWEEEFLKVHYEPEHESGQSCWCKPITEVKNGVPHITHNEQREILKDFITRLLAHTRKETAGVLLKEIMKELDKEPYSKIRGNEPRGSKYFKKGWDAYKRITKAVLIEARAMYGGNKS